MINLDIFFRYLEGRCHGYQFCERMVNSTFVALAFKNGMRYRNRNVRVNSANDACISCENFLKFGPVTPELTGLICERLVLHDQKMAYFV